MPEPTFLDLQSASGRALRHKYFQHEQGPKGILILFPGDNYGVDGPLLYYPAHLLWESGWDTLSVTYGYQSKAEPFSMEVISGMFEECGRAVQTVVAERSYPHIGLLGKSIGAALIAVLCGSENLLKTARAAYLTPPLGPLFNQAFAETSQQAYLAAGTKDRFYSEEALESLQTSRSFKLSTFQEADHSLNVVGDFDKTMAYTARLVAEVVDFFDS